VAGVKVGTITGIEPDYDHGQVIMTWKVNRGVNLGPGTTAEIAIGTLLGGLHLSLSGPVQKPYMADLPPAQRRIPIERTVLPTTVLDAIGSATNVLSKLDASAVNRVLTQVADAAVNAAEDDKVPSLLTNFNNLAAAITARGDDLDRLLDNGQKLSATLAAKDRELVAIIEAANVIFDRLAARRDQLANLLGNGSQRVKELSDVLAGKRGQLSSILNNLNVALEAAERQLPRLNQGLAWAGPTFSGLASISKHGPWLEGVFEGIGPDALGILGAVYPQLRPGGSQ
jgi:phospholipid/cholesterol/gamma-HCH transport system substrate-binding protein